MFTVTVLLHNQQLTPLQRRGMLNQLGLSGQELPPDHQIDADGCLVLWIIMLLGRLNFLSPEQRSLILDELKDAVAGYGAKCEAAITSKQSVENFFLAFNDGRYVTWHGRHGFLDLSTGDSIQQLPRPTMESLGYNLAVLFGRNRQQCAQIQRRLETRRDATDPVHTPES